MTRGKEGSKSLGNKTMNGHIKTKHLMAFQQYEEARTNKVSDPKDETERGVVPLLLLLPERLEKILFLRENLYMLSFKLEW